MFLIGVTIVSIFWLAIGFDMRAAVKKAKRIKEGNEVINRVLDKVV
jgi:uncharacterized membrane protein YciS (DUF1049 family)